ncbi:MAG: hypothetical protein M1837_007410 [Sclerophora amabilis]|nr:MAG: hypothetical protein M1837_007410 [Sclerophora amabilis]
MPSLSWLFRRQANETSTNETSSNETSTPGEAVKIPSKKEFGNNTVTNITLSNNTVVEVPPIGLGLNLSGAPLASSVGPVDFAPVLELPLGPPELITERFNLLGNLTSQNSTSSNTTNLALRGLLFLNPRGHTDWRDRFGSNFLATIQDQGRCGNCWSFAATALAETMVRIEHGIWAKKSEGDLRSSWGYTCDDGAFMDDTFAWASGGGADGSEGADGIADLDCVPYIDDDFNYYPCSDRSGRTVRLPKATPLGLINDQKLWLDTVGPIVAQFTVYDDFFFWTPEKGPYKYDGTSLFAGGHALLIVGYDDAQQSWILRNSWGPNYGDKGYWLMGYGEAGIDSYVKYGYRTVDPDPWASRRQHSGSLFQGSEGAFHRNFELAIGGSTIRTVSRDSGEDGAKWRYKDTLFDSRSGASIGQPVFTSTSFNRDYELVHWEEGGKLRRWFYSQTSDLGWRTTGSFLDGYVDGYPAFIESDYDGGFEVIVRQKDGSLQHFHRYHSDATTWYYGGTVAPNVLQSGPSLVQANVPWYADHGNFYVVGVLPSGKLQLFWRDNDAQFPPNTWHASEVFGSGIGSTPPVMIQSRWGTTDEKGVGNFELVVAKNGRVEHWWRKNDDLASTPPGSGGSGKWQHSATFGSDVKHAWALVQSSFGNSNLEVIVEKTDGRLALYYREGIGSWKFSTYINA